jgi:outer membrane protein TolC
MLSGNLALLNGTASAANSTVGIANMGSSDIRWPSKPAADAKIALDRARAAQSRLRAAQYRLRRRVLTAWYRLIYTRELLRDIHSRITNDRMAMNAVREEVVNDSTSADMPVGLSIRLIRLKLKRIELRRLAVSEAAHLNSLLNRPVHKTILTPPHLPAIERLLPSYAALLRMEVRHNHELRRQHWLRYAGETAVSRAKMQFIPNFDLGAMTSLDGAMQNLQGAVMFPIVRYRAIAASVRQAQFDVLKSEEGILSMRNDVARRLATDLIAIRSDQKQLGLIQSQLLPRLREMEQFADAKMEQNGVGLRTDLKASNSIIRIQELQLSLQLDRLIRDADIDAIAAVPVESAHQPVPRLGGGSGK